MVNSPDSKVVDIGLLVEVELTNQGGEAECLSFTVVEDKQADFKAGFLGASTPLARAILGKAAGEAIPYKAGDIISLRILSVQPSDHVQSEDIASRRQAVIKKAIDHSDYVNAMIFAGSVNSKWGDYDIGKLDPSEWGDENGEETDQETKE